LDNEGNFYFIVPEKITSTMFSVNIKSARSKTAFVNFKIIPNFIHGAEEFNLYLNSSEESKDPDYYFNEIKKYLFY